MTQQQMNKINQACKKVDEKVAAEYAERGLKFISDRQGDLGGGHFSNVYPLKVKAGTNKEIFGSTHYSP
ncbi:hypothetical protein AVI51_03535 [Piscirickettsia salmonis]|uniref:hypothetical protein n=2 Tax=Piscirickettsia salmonis TaxID=1238 RepID=UPI00030E631F|nr:hypothetical protein [Piscirickettsia salmonis]WGZ70993.1 hypothetical protein E3220_04610 [Piscirickettsia salmonis EM-90]APS45418.1 hypothetical protein AVI48_14250 [Piscirickettsia salmonis]APS48778.1 hypothetical protein AVI49_14865 [Piscirickettsia salmonis]APS50016.1 hypothetical protein AVI50_03570 [Piscirickettsia salmonis]APS53214.1 hypothetical protein AVI51_03535 [Piscirickettsia salmonis]